MYWLFLKKYEKINNTVLNITKKSIEKKAKFSKKKRKFWKMNRLILQKLKNSENVDKFPQKLKNTINVLTNLSKNKENLKIFLLIFTENEIFIKCANKFSQKLIKYGKWTDKFVIKYKISNNIPSNIQKNKSFRKCANNYYKTWKFWKMCWQIS